MQLSYTNSYDDFMIELQRRLDISTGVSRDEFAVTGLLANLAVTRIEQIQQVRIRFNGTYPEFSKRPAVDTCCIPDKRPVIKMNTKHIFNLVFNFKN